MTRRAVAPHHIKAHDAFTVVSGTVVPHCGATWLSRAPATARVGTPPPTRLPSIVSAETSPAIARHLLHILLWGFRRQTAEVDKYLTNPKTEHAGPDSLQVPKTSAAAQSADLMMRKRPHRSDATRGHRRHTGPRDLKLS